MKETFEEIIVKYGGIVTWGKDGPEDDYGSAPVASSMKLERLEWAMIRKNQQ